MPETVDALLPLSFLEAVRNVDTPEGDYDAEYVAELRNKRLGLSDTVYAQIKRFTEAVRNLGLYWQLLNQPPKVSD